MSNVYYAVSQLHIAIRILDTCVEATAVTMSHSKCAVTYKECFKYLCGYNERYVKGTFRTEDLICMFLDRVRLWSSFNLSIKLSDFFN